ncbi:MAG TPA: hypothetical protein PKJ45_08440 [Rubrivivax sp.]|nr:hypothetical protein [Rubrivivax sp.]
MGARDLLADLAAAGIRVEADGARLLVGPADRLTDRHRVELREHKGEVLALLAEPARPFRLAPADADVAHADPWTADQIERFRARVTAIQRRGFTPQDAEDLAELLHLRDLHADHRHLCLECQHLAGTSATGWRCSNARAAQVGRDLPHELATLMQSCPGFKEAGRDR